MVSIITPTYNSSKYIRDTYDAVRSQTVSDWEWLVTDDCSTDDTFDVLLEFARGDPRVKVSRNRDNSGAAATRNGSLARAVGDFIAFVDADDLWVADKLERQTRFMGDTVDFSFTAYELIDSNGVPLNRFVDERNCGAFGYEDMLRKKATLGCSTVMLRKNAFDDISMPPIRTGQDYALWLKLLKTGKTAHLLNEPLTKYRIVPGSISRNKLKKAARQWQIYREIEKLDLIKSVECFFWYALRATFR